MSPEAYKPENSPENSSEKSGKVSDPVEPARKFSALNYAAALQIRQATATSGTEYDPLPGRKSFQQTVEMIRTELVAYRAKTEEERADYSEMLNRAILGYETDRRKLLALIQDMLDKKHIVDHPLQDSPYRALSEAIFAEVIGLNILELILKNRDGLEEIQVVGRDIFEVRNGRSIRSIHRLNSTKEVERIQQNLVLFNNDSLNRRKKWAEVSLRDGSRVTMTGFGFSAEPTLTIRLYTVRHYNLQTLTSSSLSTISDQMRQMILCILRSGFNMVVIGPTNSGKTHFIKALIGELPDEERIITIESRLELMLKRDFPGKNIIEYEVDEEDRRHDSQAAFKLALRQSPQRICHAEKRIGLKDAILLSIRQFQF